MKLQQGLKPRSTVTPAKAGVQSARKYRTLARWAPFTAMMYAQITNRTSLRDLEDHFDVHSTRLYHAGGRSVRRSTLADAKKLLQAAILEQRNLYELFKPPSHQEPAGKNQIALNFKCF
ncbi:MAG: DUF4372 domain-containing protein [Proteobacteria bacterium]|nr:DUF4372 domain-containing protein [Pseudomonadota bacterium]